MLDIKLENSDECVEMTLAGTATIEHSAEIRQAFIDAMQRPGKIAVKFENVTDADLSFIQLLCSAHKTYGGMNREFEFTNPKNAAVINTAEEAGVMRDTGCNPQAGNVCLWRR